MIRRTLFAKMTSAISSAVLLKQDDHTSEAIIRALSGSARFKELSAAEGRDIIQRDNEDEVKLAAGIKIAVSKGVLEADPAVAPAKKIDVVGKTADAVAQEIMSQLPGKDGNVLVLQGLSGTGKGTTVKKLQSLLPNCVCWSNGNLFRTFTHLASVHCEEQKTEFSASVLSASLLKTFCSRIEFKKFEDGFDVVIDNATRVSTIQNTTLKMPHISARVPTVAEQTQGEVVKFAAGAVEVLRSNGCNVILEGRAQTLNYIPSNNRFELVIPDPAILGERRAAQRVMAKAVQLLGADAASSDDAAVTDAVQNALNSL
jgi:cytidylate kinase